MSESHLSSEFRTQKSESDEVNHIIEYMTDASNEPFLAQNSESAVSSSEVSSSDVSQSATLSSTSSSATSESVISASAASESAISASAASESANSASDVSESLILASSEEITCAFKDNNSSEDVDLKQSEDPTQYPCHPAPPLEVKLFVGRIPRTYTEEDVRNLMKDYGKIVSINIINSKSNNEPKGSAFVRMACLAQADAAIRALNGQKTLDEASGVLQVKYATGEADRLNINEEDGGIDQAKLFVGALPKNMTEEEIKDFFLTYGQIDEIYIMKDAGCILGKGCAFVKYAYKEQAIYAIESLDRKHTFEGQSRPLEVRFAENRTQRSSTQSYSSSSAATTIATVASQPTSYGVNVYSPIAASLPTGVTTAPLPRQAGSWREYYNHDGRPYYFNEATNTTQWDKPPEFDQLLCSVPVQSNPVTPTIPFAFPTPAASYYAGVNPAAKPGSANGGLVSQEIGIGPFGANIFIFHVPPEWTQSDLIAAFSPFGNVISARIATDRAADNKAKGYAFVSYDTIEAAASAVNHMNGFAWKGKKLKVSIKKPEESAVQHLLVPGVTPSALAQSPGVLAAAAGLYGGALANLSALGLVAAASQVLVGGLSTTSNVPAVAGIPSVATLPASAGFVGVPSVGTQILDQESNVAMPTTLSPNTNPLTPNYALCNNGLMLGQPVGGMTSTGMTQCNLQAPPLPTGQFGAYSGMRYAPY